MSMEKTIRAPQDDWGPDGKKITSPDILAIIQETLDKTSSVIVEHWHYRGGRSPDRLVFDDFEVFVEYLATKAKAGDAFHVWSFATVCTDASVFASGKLPDSDGCVPRRGAY